MQATDTPVPMTDIHDIKSLEIIAVDGSWLIYILGALLVLAVIGAAIWYWKKSRKPGHVPTEVPVSPHEAALRSLDALGDVENMDAKTFYFRLSNILRTYIEACYPINAMEMTTEELLPKIDILDIQRDILMELKTLLRSADPVKFAGVPATASKMRHDFELVKNFVTRAKD